MIEQTIRDKYLSLLRTSFAGAEEAMSVGAAELGHELKLAGFPLTEVAKMHEKAVGRLADENPEMTLSDAVHSTMAPLTEVISSFEQELPEWRYSHYRSIVENITDVIWTVDMDLKITYVNTAVERLMGYTSKEIMSLSLGEILPTVSFGKVIEVLEEEMAIEQEEDKKALFRTRTLELELKCKDGSTVWTETKANFLRDRNDKLVGYWGITSDITERKRAESLLLEQYNLGIALGTTSDLEVAIRLCVEAAIRVSGMDCGGLYFRDEISGDLNLIFHQGLSSDFVKTVSHYDANSPNTRLVMEGEPIYTQHLQLGVPLDEIEKNEGLHALAVIPIRHEDKVVGCLNVGSHILDELSPSAHQALETVTAQIGGVIARLKAGEALRESGERYRNLFENTPISIWEEDFSEVKAYIDGLSVGETDDFKKYLDLHPEVVEECIKRTKILDVNLASLDMFKARNKDELKAGLAQIFTERTLEAYKQALAALRDGQTFFEVETQQRTLDGSLIDVTLHWAAPPGYEDYSRVLVSIDDITERKQAEEKLQRAQVELSAILENAPLAMILVDMDRRIRKANGYAAKMVGRTPEEMIGLRGGEALRCLYSLDDPKGCGFGPFCETCKVRSVVLDTFETGSSHFRVEAKLPFEVNGEKEEKSFLVSTFLLEISGSQRVLVCLEDITERKRAESLLLEQYNLGDILSKTSNLEEAMRLCVEAAIRVSGMDCGGLYLRGEISGALELKFHKGLTPDLIKVASHYDADSPNTRLVMEGKPIYTQHLKLGIPVDEVKSREGLRALAVIPIRHEDKVIGCLNIGSHILDEIYIPARQTLETIAAQIGGAIIRLKAEEALRVSEQRFRDLTESTSDWIWEVDARGVYTYASPKLKDLLGYEPEEVIGKTPFDLMPPKEAKRIAREFKAITKSRKPFTGLENTNRHKDGRLIVLETSGVPVFDAGGRLLGYRGIDRDITKRRQAEEELRESEERYRNLVENSQDSIVIMDMKGNVEFANRATEELTGYSQEEGIGMNIRKVTPLKYWPISLAKLREAKSSKPITYFESVVKRKDGKVIPVESGGQAIFKGGKPVGIQAITRDISERKQAEESVRNAATEWKNTFDTMPDIVMLLDRDQRIVRANKALAADLGLPFEEILGQKCYRLLHRTNAPPDFCLSARAITDRKEYAVEMHDDRREKDFHVSATPFLDSSGKLVGAVHVMRDITELKKVQQKLREKDRLATIGEIAGGIAHEIKNPLFAITSGIQVLETEMRLKEAQKKTFDIILKETMRVDRLIRQLIEFTIRQELYRTTFQITTLINEVTTANQGLLKSREIKVKKSLPKNLPMVNADRDRIIQVLVNLLQNAIDVSDRGDTIEISCGIGKGRQNLIIRVRDMGPGIPKEDREKVFDLFFSTKKGSSGMGLAISKKIIVEHNGEIRVEPRRKGGCTFMVEIPLHSTGLT
ncbi:MAG: PAS domain S-box protein [Deltaproteobacteria bacterium]|nr:MAG: PAS domain S-box protein [Deltaproteobacteria bacterium]